MAQYARQTYLDNEILHADPVRLIQMLYRGALGSVTLSREAVRIGDIANRTRHITKASEILNELSLAVDHERGGTIAKDLVELYDYMQRLLQQAQFHQTEEPLAEVAGLLSTLSDAWDRCVPAEMVSEDQRLAITRPLTV